MALRLAIETDCLFFRFWHHDQVYEGINCQGEIFVQRQTVPLHRQDYAYDLGVQWAETHDSVVIVRGRDSYIVGIGVQSEGWQRSRVPEARLVSV